MSTNPPGSANPPAQPVTSTDSPPGSRDPALERGDQRWDISEFRDWVILAAMCLVYFIVCGAIYLFEPGIR
jgi:hypothetical protein